MAAIYCLWSLYDSWNMLLSSCLATRQSWTQTVLQGIASRSSWVAIVECTTKDDTHVTGTQRCYPEEFAIVGNDISIQGQGGRFYGPGDSGSVVFDACDQAIGLLFGGQVPHQAAGHGLVTPIEDVFEDIKASSEGRIEDIRIASS